MFALSHNSSAGRFLGPSYEPEKRKVGAAPFLCGVVEISYCEPDLPVLQDTFSQPSGADIFNGPARPLPHSRPNPSCDGQFFKTMPVTWQIGHSGIIITDASGDFGAVVDDVLSSPTVKAGMPLLVDRRSATNHQSLGELHSRAQWISTLVCRNASCRCALLARERPHSHYGLARTIAAELAVDGIVAEVFTDFGDAERWLIDGVEGPGGG